MLPKCIRAVWARLTGSCPIEERVRTSHTSPKISVDPGRGIAKLNVPRFSFCGLATVKSALGTVVIYVLVFTLFCKRVGREIYDLYCSFVLIFFE